mgnify:FL=1
MRFRLANGMGVNQGGQQLGDGIGNLFRSIAMAPLYAAQGAEDAQSADQKRRLQQSQIDENQAQIGTHLATAAIKNNELKTLEGRPDMLRLMAASRAGVSVPEFNAALSETANGAPMVGPSFLSAPIEGVGPSGRTANLQEVISTIYAPAMATPANKMNFEQLAKARGEYQDQGVLDQAVAAANGGNYMRSGALSAVRGKKEFTPFAAVGNTGTAINQVTGEQPTTNQALYTLFNNQGQALIDQRNAAAGASGAAAGASRALAGLRGVQTTNAKTQGEIDALDLGAAREGKPLPSTNKVSRAADSTNAKLDNQIYSAMMKDPAWSNAPDAEFTAELVRRRSLTPAAAKAGAPADGVPAPAAKPAPGAKKPIDMTAANQVKADFKAGKISMQQAKAKLQQLGMD